MDKFKVSLLSRFWQNIKTKITASMVKFTDGETIQYKFDNGKFKGDPGSPGSSGLNGYPGWGIAFVDSSVTPTSLNRSSSFKDVNSNTFYSPYYGTGSSYYSRHIAYLIIQKDTGKIYYYNGDSSNCYTDSGFSIFGKDGKAGTNRKRPELTD